MRFQSLHALRGLAALCVLLGHVHAYLSARVPSHENPSTAYDLPLPRRWCFFLVISGFFMAYLLHTQPRWFLLRRLLRIFPAYLLAAALALLAKFLLLHETPAWNVLTRMTLLPLGPDGPPFPLAVEWTLVYQIFFYAVCALFANRLLGRWFLWAMIPWLIAIAFAATLRPIGNLLWPRWHEIALSPANVLFIAGTFAYHAYTRLPRPRWPLLLASLTAGTACYAAAEAIPLSPAFRSALAALISPGFVMMSLYGLAFAFLITPLAALDRSRPSPLLWTRPLERLGDAAYGIYLLHVPVILIILALAAHAPIPRLLLAFLTAILALAITYLFGLLEHHIHTHLKRLLPTTPKPPPTVPLPSQRAVVSLRRRWLPHHPARSQVAAPHPVPPPRPVP